MPRNQKNRIGSAAALFLAAFPLTTTTLLAPSPVLAQTAGKITATDKLILRSGRIIEGKVLEETDTQVKFMIITAGISAEQWFSKADLLKVEKAEPASDAAAATAKPDEKRPDAKKPALPDADARKVYVIDLKGKFGEDITQTPIRQAVDDARAQGTDVLIFVMDNEWALNQGGLKEELPNDEARFDELFRAEEMTPIFMNEIPREWDRPPKVVFWVKQAMGGAAFLPFVSPNVYMTSDARWGGIGNLSTMFGSTGDEMVRQKQYSLRMGHAEGWAIAGGYDFRIVKAMARVEYVLSYKLIGGRPEFLERMPENPDEFLLTDDGNDQAGREDTIQALARGQGDDVLTLNADLARKLGVSKGTVDRLDDLIFELGLGRNSTRVDDRAPKIMEGWTRSLTDAKSDLRRLIREFNDIQVQGDYAERSRARGARIAKCNEMKRIIMRFKEALTPQWFAQNGFVPGSADNLIAWIDGVIEQIKLEQMQDKR